MLRQEPAGVCTPLQRARFQLLAVRLLRNPRGRLLALLGCLAIFSIIFVALAAEGYFFFLIFFDAASASSFLH